MDLTLSAAAAASGSQREADTAHLIANPPPKKPFNHRRTEERLILSMQKDLLVYRLIRKLSCSYRTETDHCCQSHTISNTQSPHVDSVGSSDRPAALVAPLRTRKVKYIENNTNSNLKMEYA